MTVRIAYSAARQIADHAFSETPQEACGLLAGTHNHIMRCIPLANISPSPATHFLMDPREQVRALKEIDVDDVEWIGVYHSHPMSPPIPSPTDIADTVDYSLLQLIVSLEHATPQLKLWQVGATAVTPLELVFDTAAAEDREPSFTRRQQLAIVAIGIACLLITLVLSFSLLPPAPDLANLP